MQLIYSVGIYFYKVILYLLAPFHNKARLMIQGRKNWKYKLAEFCATHPEPLIWMHTSSLGEFEQGRPIIEALKSKYPSHKIVLSFFSPSGYEIRKNYPMADFICYLPMDTPANARRFIQLLKPSLVLFVKYDFWYNYLKNAATCGARILLVSGIFRPNQIFFRWYGQWYKRVLTLFDQLFLQNAESKAILHQAGIDKACVAGDCRIDRVMDIAREAQNFDIIDRFASNNKVLVCGSTWPPDEDIILQHFNSNLAGFKLILAPHQIDEGHLASIERKTSRPFVRYSTANAEMISDIDLLIIDNIGMLSSLYRYGFAAYIGGGFGVSIHNTLEAAVYGIPVLFGPRFTKFQEAVDMVKIGAAFVIHNTDDYRLVLDSFLSNENTLSQAGYQAAEYIQQQSGATDIVMKYIAKNIF